MIKKIAPSSIADHFDDCFKEKEIKLNRLTSVIDPFEIENYK